MTRIHDGRRQVIAAADRAARRAGLRPGLPLAQAQARIPGVVVMEADLTGDQDALGRVAAWCLRYAPLAAPDPPDGVWLDVTGCAHLQGSEAGLLGDLLGRLRDRDYTARAAVAGTPGAAHALARFGAEDAISAEPGRDATAIAPLSVAALRLAPDTAGVLGRLGLDSIGQLLAAPRALLARRFGPGLLLRLDQATGRVFESIEPQFPPELVQHRLAFAEPLISAEALSTVIGRLVPEVCGALERAGQGARRLDLLFERVDGTVQAIRVGTSRPSRDPRHLGRMLDERLEEVDPDPGVEAMCLVASVTEPLAWSQQSASLSGGTQTADLASLVDRLSNRLGADRVFRVQMVESDVPERSQRLVPALTADDEANWPTALPRPVRLLSPPQPVQAVAELPDRAPAAFTWRGARRRVRGADGPERIHGEWWRRDSEMGSVRDYWQVEDETGCRYWLFRRGDGANRATGDLSWFLHGLF